MDRGRVELPSPQCECGALPDKLTARVAYASLAGKLTALVRIGFASRKSLSLFAYRFTIPPLKIARQFWITKNNSSPAYYTNFDLNLESAVRTIIPVQKNINLVVTDFYIFRHGDTERTNNLLFKFLIGIKDSRNLKILPKAVPALKKIGEFLKNIPTNENFRSPYLRCEESAQIVSEYSKKKFIVDNRIREFEANGEKFSDFYKRVSSFLNDVQKKNYPAVSICTHGAVIAALKYMIIYGSFHHFQVFDYPSPGEVLIIKDKKVERIDFNSKK